MATELNYDKLVAYVKKHPEATQKAVAEALGLTIGQVSMLKFQQAKVEAGILKKIPGTAKAIKDARDKQGLRWEAIAAATGLSPAGVKAKYEEAGGSATESYTGRGRNFNGASKPASKPAAKKPASKAASKAASKSASKPATRRASGAAAKKEGSSGVTRRITRRTSASNPS